MSRDKPTKILELSGKNIVNIACGTTHRYGHYNLTALNINSIKRGILYATGTSKVEPNPF